MNNNTLVSNTPSVAAPINSPEFEIGDEVLLADTGEQATIMAVHNGVAWVFVEHEGFETVDYSEMSRPPQQPKLPSKRR